MTHRNTMSEKQFLYICMIVGIGGLLVIGGVEEAGHESYLSAIAALAVVIPMIFIYSACIDLQRDKGIFELSKKVFGEIFGRIITAMLVLYAFISASMLLTNFTNFINTTLLSDVPPVFVGGCFMLCAAYMVYNGVGVIGRIGSAVGKTTLAILIVTQLVAVSNLNESSTVLPFAPNGAVPIILGGLDVFASAFGDVLLVLPLAARLKKESRPKRAITGGSLLAVGVLTVIFLRNLLILGEQCTEILYFKSFFAVSTMTFGRFFERLETAVSAAYIISDFVKLGASLYFIREGFNGLFSKEEGTPVFPIALTVTMLSVWLFGNEQELLDFKLFYKYAAPFFQLGVPILLILGAKIKSRRSGALLPAGSVTGSE